MSKKNEIKKVLTQLTESKGLTSKISDTKLENIAESLSNLNDSSKAAIKLHISSGVTLIKESIDFSDTDHWINMIAEIINKK